MIKSFSFLLVLIIPAAVHAQTTFQMGGGMQISSGGVSGTSGSSQAQASSAVKDSVQVSYTGTEADTTVYVPVDSAMTLLKGSHAQVIFIKTIPAAGDPQPAVRSTRQALAKIPPSRITMIAFTQGDALVKQFGDVGKNGTVTVTVKMPPPPAKKS
ncbi:MAG TPA: hypothetical protein VNU46_06040 [Gemmatimonadaceae bacterium]|jgi:hypothetical protein|nr:hypothetical protein [Gemmatimonadaceae bacterium]